MDHSVPGSTAYLIEDKNGKKIVYTGDFRFHGIQGELTSKFEEEIKNEAPDILITEGTRIDEEIKDDEEKVFQDTLNRVKSTTGLVMVDFAWKDITRYLTMKKVAEASKKTLVISSKLAYVIHKLKEFANLNIKSVEEEDFVKVYLRRKYGMLYSKSDYVNTKYDLCYSVKWDRKDPSTISEVHFKNGVRAYQIREKPSQYMLQLAFYDLSELIDLKPPPGSVYIKATSEPFDEEMKFDEKRLCNWFELFGLNAPECKPIYINASGHAYGPEIKDFISRVQPGIIIPIHTKNPKEFEKSFANVVVPEKGVPLDIDTL